ncbi:pyridoxal phosphate-dependent aminotransferase [Aspergillus foveolatus]|uniref:pyridoxal phosphate-dependent aminotransferase n=1 Tax=Aspergillus foveolatus TaxID=210207 RepID=UPI003CCD44B6
MANNLSSRGLALEANKPVFFDVLNNLWDPSNPDGIVNIGLAENGLMQTEMKSFINSQKAAESHSLTYGDGFTGSKKLKEAMCHFLNRHFQPYRPLQPSHMCITAGASNAIENSAWALCDPGDYVLVGRPYWTTFRSIFGNRAGVNILEVTMGDIDPMGLDAILRFEEVAEQARLEGKKVKAILLCSPNNPLGRCYPEEVLKSYMRLCQNLGIHLISDELYGLSVWHNPSIDDPTSFTSVLSIDTNNLVDPQLIHAVWGLSKDFGATGLRIGVLISQSNPQFLNACESISLFSFPSSLADKAVTSFLANDMITDSFIFTNRARLSESYQFVTGFCRANGIPYTQSNAALFVWINLGAIAKDTTMTDDEILSRTRREKVYLTSGATYASEEQGWFRVVMAHPRHVLEEGLNRMLRALR